jgi:hypothetical protein
MRHAVIALALMTAPAAAAGLNIDAAPAIPHVAEARYAENQPQRYPTTWGDEAAQRMGVQDGKWEAFRTTPSSRFEPSLDAGVDQGNAMLRLQWH